MNERRSCISSLDRDGLYSSSFGYGLLPFVKTEVGKANRIMLSSFWIYHMKYIVEIFRNSITMEEIDYERLKEVC